jgi:hypothetical protein
VGTGKEAFAPKRGKGWLDHAGNYPGIRSLIADTAEGKHLGRKDGDSKFPGGTTGQILRIAHLRHWTHVAFLNGLAG